MKGSAGRLRGKAALFGDLAGGGFVVFFPEENQELEMRKVQVSFRLV